ncbi:MAG: glycosyltransferase family 9 protein [Gemmatimonadaceae bacterium]
MPGLGIRDSTLLEESVSVTQFATPLPSPERQPRSAEPAESLVIQTSFLGDTVLTTPLIAELAMRGPVDVVVTPAAAPLLANNPYVRRLVIYDKRADDSGLYGLWRAGRGLRGRRVAPPAPARRERRANRVAYLAQGSVRSATLAVLAGCDERVGFATSPARRLYTARVPYRDDRHHAERLWRLAFPDRPDAEPDADSLRPRLYPGRAEREAVESALAAGGGLRADERVVAMAPGSVWGTKRWPHYPELATRLGSRCVIAIVGSAADSEAARAISAARRAGGGEGSRTLDLTGKLSLLASAEMIGRAVALVTNDSSPQHLASAMGTRTITLFGPTVPQFGFGPLAPGSESPGLAALPCRPCHHHGPETCPLGHWRCMRELSASSIEGLLLPSLA